MIFSVKRNWLVQFHDTVVSLVKENKGVCPPALGEGVLPVPVKPSTRYRTPDAASCRSGDVTLDVILLFLSIVKGPPSNGCALPTLTPAEFVDVIVRLTVGVPNVATMVLGPSMVSNRGDAAPLVAPDHPMNELPAFGIGVRVTTVPFAYHGPDGFGVTAPPPTVSMVMAYSGSQVQFRVMLLVILKGVIAVAVPLAGEMPPPVLV